MNLKPRSEGLPEVWALVQAAHSLIAIVNTTGQERAKHCAAARETKWFAKIVETCSHLAPVQTKLWEAMKDEDDE